MNKASGACRNKRIYIQTGCSKAGGYDGSSARKVFIPRYVAQYLIELKQEQDEIKAALGNEYHDYNLVMATTFGLPIGDSYLRNKMQDIIDELGLPDVVFHSLRHTSVTYKLKLSGGDIKAVQ